MARECYMCGKKKSAGNQVSHAHNTTRRSWEPNLHKKAVDLDGKKTQKYICTKCLKTLKKEENK